MPRRIGNCTAGLSNWLSIADQARAAPLISKAFAPIPGYYWVFQDIRVSGDKVQEVSMLPLLFPAGKLPRKTPVMNGPASGNQRTRDQRTLALSLKGRS